MDLEYRGPAILRARGPVEILFIIFVNFVEILILY